MTVYSAVGLCLCGAAAIFIIKELKREYVPAVTLGVGITVILAFMPRLAETVEMIKNASEHIDTEYAGVVLRALGVAYLTSTAAEISRSCGELSIGTYIETVGKIEILALAAPLFYELFGLALLK